MLPPPVTRVAKSAGGLAQAVEAVEAVEAAGAVGAGAVVAVVAGCERYGVRKCVR